MSDDEEIERCGCDESVQLRRTNAELAKALESSRTAADVAISRLADALHDRERLSEVLGVPPESLRKAPNPMQTLLAAARALHARLDAIESENVTLRNEVISLRAKVDRIRSEVTR